MQRDSHGRALWALGAVLGHSQDAGLRGAAGRLFEAAVPAALTFRSPRAWAFGILGMQAYLDWFPGDRAIQGTRNLLANRLLDIYERSRTDTWHWFEKSLAYSNARLSQALIVAGWRGENQKMVTMGIESLEWLVAAQHRGDEEIFVPIGSSGFYAEGKEKARFDQQPVEACATVSACLQAYRLTNKKHWLEEAQHVFHWFLGNYADIREGDARQMLRDLGGHVDFALIDGWPNGQGPSLAREVIEILAPQIRTGGYVVNDNAEPDFLQFIRDPANGFISVSLPLKGSTELCVKVS